MKVALFIHSVQCGGAERVIVMMANHWASKGHKVFLLTFDDGSEPPFYPLDPNITYLPLNLKTKSTKRLIAYYENVRRLYGIRRSLQRIQPDVVISFIDMTNIFTLVATIGMGLPLIISERTNPRCYSIGRWDKIRSLTYPLADVLVCQTKIVQKYFSEKIRVKTTVIPNPVILPTYEGTPKLLLPKPCIMALGRLQYEKGHDILIRAFAQLNKVHSDWKLVIVGEGNFRQELENLRMELHVEDSVLLPGMVQNPYPILKQADIFVHPSRFEGFPNALCEAMACGLPVIASDCPIGPSEIISNKKNGWLVKNEDVQELAFSLDFLIKNKNERKRLGDNAQNIVHRFGIEQIMNQWEDLILTVKQ